MAERTPLDPEQIFSALASFGVEYVVVGGLAVQVHGHVRMTNDVDLIPEPTPANLGRLAEALRALDARILNPGSEEVELDALTLPRAALWQLATRHGDIDVLNDAPGMPPYAQLRARALTVQPGDVSIAVAGLDDLIRMKIASGRPVDLSDVAALSEPEQGD